MKEILIPAVAIFSIFGLPIFFYVMQLILQLTYFRHDSVKYLLLEGKKHEAEREI